MGGQESGRGLLRAGRERGGALGGGGGGLIRETEVEDESVGVKLGGEVG